MQELLYIDLITHFGYTCQCFMRYLEARSARRTLERDVESAMDKGEKRDFLSDVKKIIETGGVKYEFKFDEPQLKNKPTIFAANHFKRRSWERISLNPTHMIGNTRESLIIAGLISMGAQEIYGKSSSWLIQENIKTKVGPASLKYASMQKDFIKTYDHIAIPDTVTRETLPLIREQVQDRIRRGKDIAVFAERDPSYKMRKNGRILKNALKLLNKEFDLQVVPVSVSYQNGIFIAHFSRAIQPSLNPKRDVEFIVSTIASKLPFSMRPQGL